MGYKCVFVTTASQLATSAIYICKLNVLVCSLYRAVHGSKDEADLASSLSGIIVGGISAG